MYHGERFNGYSHLLGLLLATAGSALLLAKTVPGDDPAKTGERAGVRAVDGDALRAHRRSSTARAAA